MIASHIGTVVAGMDGNGAESEIDPEEALSDVSLVIASNREKNYTADSSPEYLETIVRMDDGRNRARNQGVAESSGEWIVIADDDITFPTTLTAQLVAGMEERHVVGLEDFPPMRWILTRYVVFHRSTWETVGGFDERREHGGDTDFAIRAEKAGRDVLRLPRGIVPHHDEDSSFEKGEHIEWLWYLFRRHPRQIAPKAIRIIASSFGNSINSN